MREETRRRLERELLVRKLRWTALAAAGLVAAASVIYLEGLDASVTSTSTLPGTVVHVGPPAAKYRAAKVGTSLQVDVRLEDARVAHLISPRDVAPKIGDHVMLVEKVLGSGRHTFAWR